MRSKVRSFDGIDKTCSIFAQINFKIANLLESHNLYFVQKRERKWILFKKVVEVIPKIKSNQDIQKEKSEKFLEFKIHPEQKLL